MIEINLLPGKKKKRKAASGLALPDFGELFGKIRDPLMLAAVGSWLIVVPFVGYTYYTEGAKLAVLQEDSTRIEGLARQYRSLLRTKQRQQRLGDSLVAELASIRDIDAERYIWPHILEEVTKALPDFTWLVSLEFVPAPAPDITAEPSEVSTPPVSFTIAGRTADLSGYTRFTRNLANSPWIGDVQLGGTQQVLDNDKQVISFTITATFQTADSAFIRTVPLEETVR
ncbi:MAG: PilN domain-containing protein [Gemmatimonadales bacterium]